MSKNVKVTLGPSLAEKQKVIDSLSHENEQLRNSLENLQTSYAEMEARCYKYADMLLETKDEMKRLQSLVQSNEIRMLEMQVKQDKETSMLRQAEKTLLDKS